MYPLVPGMKYRAVLSNLRTYSGIRDTVHAPVIEVKFTTTELPHYLLTNNYLQKFKIKCSDTLQFQFNRRIDPNTFNLDSILRVDRLDSIHVLTDSTYQNCWTRANLNTWQDASGKILYARPTQQFVPGMDYRIKIKTSYINGDTIMDSEARITIKDLVFVKIENLLLPDSTEMSFSMTSPSKGTKFTKYGDTLSIYSITSMDSLAFSYYQIISASNDTTYNYNSSFDIFRNCDELDDITVRAFYRIKDTMNLTLDSVNGAYTSVYDKNYNYLGGAGSYRVAPDDYVIINLDSLDYGKKFNGYTSNNISVQYRELSNINVYNKGKFGNITIGPDIDDTPDRPYYMYNINVVLDDVTCVDQKTNLFYGSELAWGEPEPIAPAQLEVKHPFVHIGSDYLTNMEIYKMVVQMGSSQPVETVFTPPLTEWNASMTATKPYKTITLYIRPVSTYTITVETELIKYTPNSIAEIGKDVYIQVIVKNCAGIEKLSIPATYSPFVISGLQGGDQVYVFAMGYQNTGPDYGYAFDFLNWKDDNGYYFSYISTDLQQIPNTAPSFYFNVTQDVTVGGIFKENFRIEQIGVYRNDLDTPTWYTLSGFANLQTELGGVIDEIDTKRYDLPPNGNGHLQDDGFMSKILFKFNNEPDLTSLSDYPYFNIYSEELTDRVDGQRRGTHYTALGGVNAVLSSNDNTIMEFTLMDKNNMMIPKGMNFNLHIRNGIKDILNNPMKLYSNTSLYNFILYTELPGVIAGINEVKINQSSGDGAVELHEIAYASILDVLNKTQIYPYTGNSSLQSFGAQIPNGDTRNINQELVSYWEMKRNYALNVNVISYDEDGYGINPDDFESYLYPLGIALLLASLGLSVEGKNGTQSPINPNYYYIVVLQTFITNALIATVILAALYALYQILNNILSSNSPDYLGGENFQYPWNEYWFGASQKAKNLRQSIWFWNNDYMNYKGEVKLKKQDDYWINDTY